jgi:DNA primase
MIKSATIDRIFDAVDIVDVVSDFVNISKKGADYKGVCPFHDDKNPSMSVSPSRGIYKCFSCGAGGNAIKFVMDIESLTYPQALRFLANKYNIEVEEDDITIDELDSEAKRKDGIYNSLSFSNKYFKQKLHHSEEGKNIYLSYLIERGIREDTIEHFSLGLSGLKYTEFLTHAITNGFSPQQLFEAGLVKKNNEEEGVLQQNLRDTFLERITFPIHDVSGKVIGFGGRIIKKDTKAPKYLNSPETLVYEKRKVLYGLFQNKQEIRKRNEVILVEGYMDVIGLHQVGLNYAIAASGTAFTPEQSKLIKRFTENVTLIFDGDAAGINAAIKHIETLLESNLNLKIVILPDGEDPDSLAAKLGKSGIEQYIEEHQKNFVAFFISIKTEGSSDPLKKAEAARLIAKSCAVISDPLKRNAYIQEAANMLEFDPALFIDEANRAFKEKLKERKIDRNYNNLAERSGQNYPELGFVSQKKELEKPNHFKALLKLIIKYGQNIFDENQTVLQFVMEDLESDEMWPEEVVLKIVFGDISQRVQDGIELDDQYFIKNIHTSELAAEVFSEKYQLSKAWFEEFEKKIDTEDDNYKMEVISCLNYLKLSKIENAIRANLKEIENTKDDEKLIQLLQYDMNLKEACKKITEELGIVIKPIT